ncbi:flagellar hook-length control protein FliK [Brevundimonas naejangsanensis]|uniref:flagellar hook-length control protein FliK n=1 Tax=Brevundimonas naejangsanensis TaxID=588932 RepID=UPI0026ED9F2D|nr:flagellar hook-length control protein FliK [Brevundimonas naejangsanensis]
MSAINILSVLTPAAPGGAGPDASIEAATDSAMFADLMLKEETPEAPAPPPVRRPAAQTESEDLGAAGAMIPVWFAPAPEPQQPAAGAPTLTIEGDDAPLKRDAAAEEPAFEKAAASSTEATTQGAEPVAAAAPAVPSAFAAPANPAAPAASGLAPSAAAPLPALKAAAVVAAGSDAPIEAATAESEVQTDGSTPDRAPPPPPSGPPPAMSAVTGFRSGAGERLASAREVVQAAAQAEDSEPSAADRLKTSDAPATVAAGAVARPATAATLPTPPTPALAPSAADADAPIQSPAAAPTSAPQQESAAPRDLGLSHLSRATVETTAQIAAQIIKKLDGRSTRFDMALTPEGLGRVDVSLEIESDGQVTARLAFDTPAAAADLRARADELRRQLLEAGLHLSSDDLEFAERDPSSGFSGGAFERQPDRRAFTGAARLAAEADSVVPPPSAWTSLSLTPDRVDLKV